MLSSIVNVKHASSNHNNCTKDWTKETPMIINITAKSYVIMFMKTVISDSDLIDRSWYNLDCVFLHCSVRIRQVWLNQDLGWCQSTLLEATLAKPFKSYNDIKYGTTSVKWSLLEQRTPFTNTGCIISLSIIKALSDNLQKFYHNTKAFISLFPGITKQNFIQYVT